MSPSNTANTQLDKVIRAKLPLLCLRGTGGALGVLGGSGPIAPELLARSRLRVQQGSSVLGASLFWLLCKHPKGNFSDVSLSSFRKGFSWQPGGREQGCGRVIIPEQPGISSALWETGEGVRVTDSSSFCGLGNGVLGDIFLSMKGRIQV